MEDKKLDAEAFNKAIHRHVERGVALIGANRALRQGYAYGPKVPHGNAMPLIVDQLTREKTGTTSIGTSNGRVMQHIYILRPDANWYMALQGLWENMRY